MEERNDKNNERVARSIWHEAIQCSVKSLKWGIDFCTVRTVTEGTAFHVNAAWVYINFMRKDGSFRLTIVFDNKKSRFVEEGLLLGNLVSAIDDALRHGHTSDNPECHSQRDISEQVAV